MMRRISSRVLRHGQRAASAHSTTQLSRACTLGSLHTFQLPPTPGASRAFSTTPTPPPLDLNASVEVAAEVAAPETLNFLSQGHLMFLDMLHTAGLPWWCSIAAYTLSFRTLILPLVRKQMIVTTLMQKVKPELDALQEQKTQGKLDQMEYTKAFQQLYAGRGIKVSHAMLSIVAQMPFMISLFIALRSVDLNVYPAYATGGLAWWTDLSVMDPYYVLPVISGAITLAAVQVGGNGENTEDPRQKMMKKVMYVMVPAITFMTCNFPAGVFCFWITTNFYSSLQGVALKSDKFRLAVGIPIVTQEEKALWEAASPEKVMMMSPTEKLEHTRRMASLSKQVTNNAKEGGEEEANSDSEGEEEPITRRRSKRKGRGRRRGNKRS